nr:hypothetical protein Iba_chr02fCG8460 [Ipomoea batatas]
MKAAVVPLPLDSSGEAQQNPLLRHQSVSSSPASGSSGEVSRRRRQCNGGKAVTLRWLGSSSRDLRRSSSNSGVVADPVSWATTACEDRRDPLLPWLRDVLCISSLLRAGRNAFPVTANLSLCMHNRRERNGEKRGRGGKSKLFVHSQRRLVALSRRRMELSIVRSLPCIVTSPSSSEVPAPPPVTAVFPCNTAIYRCLYPLDDASPPFAALILFLAHRVRSVPCVFVMAKLSFSGGCRLSNKG